MKNTVIITIGISPCWDIICRIKGIEWGEHRQIAEQVIRPAGKAMNVSRCLHWMGVNSIAAGLWGEKDYELLLEELAELKRRVRPQFTIVPGRTRNNITVSDLLNRREMHLRAHSELATRRSLKKLQNDLKKIAGRFSICVFSGALPEGQLLDGILDIVKCCRDEGAKIVIDSSGSPLCKLVDLGDLWLIKPNLQELAELVGKSGLDGTIGIINHSQPLLSRAENILVSRGENGALLVTGQGCWQGLYQGRERTVVGTVGCGDYLLAGFLSGITNGENPPEALKLAVQSGTAHALGFTEVYTWIQARRKLKIAVQEVDRDNT